MKSSNRSIILFGDTIIDIDVEAEATGLSLESPTLKANHVSQNSILGGAANVARHLSELGAEVTFVTDVPENECAHLIAEGINTISLNSGKANIKKRFWISKGDARYKYLQINETGISPAASNEPKIKKIIADASFDRVAVSDYRCGLVTKTLCSQIIRSGMHSFAASQISDKPANFDWFDGFDIVVCNEKEALHTRRSMRLCVTLGEGGCRYDGKIFSSEKIEVASAIGAGDAFFAAFIFSEDPVFANDFAKKFLSHQNGKSDGRPNL